MVVIKDGFRTLILFVSFSSIDLSVLNCYLGLIVCFIMTPRYLYDVTSDMSSPFSDPLIFAHLFRIPGLDGLIFIQLSAVQFFIIFIASLISFLFFHTQTISSAYTLVSICFCWNNSNRSLMNRIKSNGDRVDPCTNPLLVLIWYQL